MCFSSVHSILSSFVRSFSHSYRSCLICPMLSLFFSPPSRPFLQWFNFHPSAFISLCFRCLFFSLVPGGSLWRFSGASCSSLFTLVILTGEFNSAIRVHHILFVFVILSYVGDSFQPILFIQLSLFHPERWRCLRVSCFQFFNYFEGLTSSSPLLTGAISIFLATFSNGDFLWVGP